MIYDVKYEEASQCCLIWKIVIFPMTWSEGCVGHELPVARRYNKDRSSREERQNMKLAAVNIRL